jgi:hypothetical protein
MRLLLRDNLLLNSQHTAKVFRLLRTRTTAHAHTDAGLSPHAMVAQILTSVAGFSPSSLLAMYWRTMLHTFVDKYPLTSLRPTKIWVCKKATSSLLPWSSVYAYRADVSMVSFEGCRLPCLDKRSWQVSSVGVGIRHCSAKVIEHRLSHSTVPSEVRCALTSALFTCSFLRVIAFDRMLTFNVDHEIFSFPM